MRNLQECCARLSAEAEKSAVSVSPLQEADPDHQFLVSEVEQMEERSRTIMKRMESEEGLLKCFMLSGCSWNAAEAFLGER